MVRRRDDLSRPRRARRIGVHPDPDAFGNFAEGIARFLGTARFLAVQTVVVFFWISLNAVSWRLRWDPYPFILLNLAFSTQAAYAAPLILLAQSRQEARDRAQTERDRETSERTKADTEFLARELASVRLALADTVTTGELDERVDRVVAAVDRLVSRLDELTPGPAPG